MEKYSDKVEKSEKNPNDRKEYSRKYHRKRMGFPEPKIKDITTLLSDIKKSHINPPREYPVSFPKEELNEKLDEILEDGVPITEKTLKDIIMWDILDKKGILTPERIVRLYHGSNWGNAIEEFMQAREYFGELVGDGIVYKLRTE